MYQRSKYGAIKTVIGGLKFDSCAEANRFLVLRALQQAKRIGEITLQKRFPITINGIKVCDYVADFVYNRDGETVVEDVKGFKTAVYNLKKKIMLDIYWIYVLEVA